MIKSIVLSLLIFTSAISIAQDKSLEEVLEGKIILDDDSLLMNYPVYVIKNESQYNCISYRYLYFKNINKI